jgi:hypothetical protein
VGVKHRSNRLGDAAVARDVHARATCHGRLLRAGAERHVVHDNEVLSQRLDVRLRPVCRGVRLERGDYGGKGRVRILPDRRRSSWRASRVSRVIHSACCLSRTSRRHEALRGEADDGATIQRLSHSLLSSGVCNDTAG